VTDRCSGARRAGEPYVAVQPGPRSQNCVAVVVAVTLTSAVSARGHTLSRSADGRSDAVVAGSACAVEPRFDVYERPRTWVNETTTETSEDRSHGRVDASRDVGPSPHCQAMRPTRSVAVIVAVASTPARSSGSHPAGPGTSALDGWCLPRRLLLPTLALNGGWAPALRAGCATEEGIA
jgi:hypothetical protein